MAESTTVGAGTGNTAPSLTTTTVLLFLWAAATYVVRIWAKLSKGDKWGSDDSTISFALVAALGHVVSTTLAIHNGYGNPWASLSEGNRLTIHKAVFAGQICYVMAVGLTRVSTSFFTARFLTRDQRNIQLAHGFTATFGVLTIASDLVVAIRGLLREPWETLDGSETMWTRWLIIESINVFMDLSTFALCVYFIWGLHMPLGKRITVIGIFICRLGQVHVLPIIGLRIWHLSPSMNTDSSVPDLTSGILTEAAMQSALILASVTCLKPFLRPFHTGYSVGTASSTAPAIFGTRVKSARSTYYELSAARSTVREDEKHHVVTENRDLGYDGDEQDLIHKSELPLRPDGVNYRASVGAGSGRNMMDGDMHISKTQNITISYD